MAKQAHVIQCGFILRMHRQRFLIALLCFPEFPIQKMPDAFVIDLDRFIHVQYTSHLFRLIKSVQTVPAVQNSCFGPGQEKPFPLQPGLPPILSKQVIFNITCKPFGHIGYIQFRIDHLNIVKRQIKRFSFAVIDGEDDSELDIRPPLEPG